MNSYVVIRTTAGTPIDVWEYADQDVVASIEGEVIEVANITNRSVETLERPDGAASVEVLYTASSTTHPLTAWRFGECVHAAYPNPYVRDQNGLPLSAHADMADYLSHLREDELEETVVIERDGTHVWYAHGDDFLQFTPTVTIKQIKKELDGR